jgi:hypothetical protein
MWKPENSPKEILDSLLTRIISYFGQAQGTPFTTNPLLSRFGYDGMSIHGTEPSQSGTIPSGIDNISTATRDVIERFSSQESRHPIHSDLLQYKSFVSTIKKWKEATSTSASGRHLGHYKSLLAIDSKSSSYNEANPDPGPELIRVLYHLAVTAFQSGILLLRWTNITTCMIEKNPGTKIE